MKWETEYDRRRTTAAEAMKCVKSGDRVVFAHACGEPLDLTPLEFKLLSTLVTRAGRVQSRERLLSDVWEMSSELETRTVDTHVKRLREKLGAGRDLLETVRGVGYRLLDPADEG